MSIGHRPAIKRTQSLKKRAILTKKVKYETAEGGMKLKQENIAGGLAVNSKEKFAKC